MIHVKYIILIAISLLVFVGSVIGTLFEVCFWTGCRIKELDDLIFPITSVYTFLFSGYIIYCWKNAKQFNFNEPALFYGIIILIIAILTNGYHFIKG